MPVFLQLGMQERSVIMFRVIANAHVKRGTIEVRGLKTVLNV